MNPTKTTCIQPLIDYFSKYIPLEKEEEDFLATVFKKRRLKRRQFVLQEGDVCKITGFVLEGCFRMYMIDENSKEHNLQFAIENWWIVDLASFTTEEPSQLYIEAMENSVILEINRKDRLKLFETHPKFNDIFRRMTEKALVTHQKRVLRNISATAEERYLVFIEKYPHFFNRISNVQIASYLGVTPEFLSTIRKRMAKS